MLKAKHPEVQLVASADPFTDRRGFKTSGRKLREIGADIVDEHFYRPPTGSSTNASRYDTYPRTGPKMFVGEYAAHMTPGGERRYSRNTWQAALAEAAFMTGLERNADMVRMSSYAPLFAHVDAWQWSPNLIWFDNLESFGTPSYYVQQLFASNRGDTVLPVTRDSQPVAGQDGLFASASKIDGRGFIVKLVNTGDAPLPVRIEVAGGGSGDGVAIVLTGDLMAENSLSRPDVVKPVEEPAAVMNGIIERTLPPHSLTVLRPGR